MTDRKLTEAEMISYLELSVAIGSTARLAPEEAKTLLDLINRQRAEIEVLQHKYELAVAEREANVKGFTETLEKQRVEIERLKNINKKLDGFVLEARAEAVKEFAHFLIDNSTKGTISISDLPDLVIQKTEERTE